MTTSAFEELLLCPNLPTLPLVAVEILELTRDPNVKMKDIERLVQTDQGLASRVLRTVNSSLYSLRKPCSTIERALTYLGLNAVKSLVLGFSLVDVSKGVGEDDGFDMSTYWQRVIFSSAGGRIIGVATRSCDPDEAFTCGIFQDIGMLAAIVGMPRKYVPLLVKVGDDRHDELPAAEQQAFKFDHAEVGEALARKWKMPDCIAACVGSHHNPDCAPREHSGLVRSVYLGGLLAEALNNENAASLVRKCDMLLYKWFGKIDATMEELLMRISESAADFARVLEKKVSQPTDVKTLMSLAQEQQFEQQILAHREVDTLRQTNVSLEHATATDALTNIGNRKKFNAELSQHFKAAVETGTPVGLLFSDVDRFKPVNDTYGHQAGDAILVELAARMANTVGDRGFVCRYGGEEFAVVLPGHTMEDSATVAEEIRTVIESAPFDLRQIEGVPDELAVTASVGVSAMDPQNGRTFDTPEQLTAHADAGVYAAKEAGRNCVRIAGANAETRAATPAAPADPAVPGDPGDPASDPAAPPAPLSMPTATPPINTFVAGPQPEADAESDIAPLGSGTFTGTSTSALTSRETSAGSAAAAASTPAAMRTTPRTTPRARTSAMPADGIRRILLVEDDALAATLVTAMFERLPKTSVVVASTITEARSVLTECITGTKPMPDLILCDFQLPDGVGSDLVGVVRASRQLQHLPAVVLTAHSDPAHYEQCLDAGADAVYAKQVISRDLQAWMRQLVKTYVQTAAAA